MENEMSEESNTPEIDASDELAEEEEPNSPLSGKTPDLPEFLTATELEVVFFIERYHSANGEVPTRKEILRRFKDIHQGWLGKFEDHPLVQKSMAARGILYPAAEDTFTAEQMAAISAMLSYNDRRSDEKKLRDIGVTTRQWSNWLQNDKFASHVRARSERLLDNVMHEAHLGLIKGLRNGNVASIKQYYEMTGRYRPDADNQVDVRALLHSFIEVIQRHIKDPVVLHGIATDMTNLASRETMSNAIMGKSQPFQPPVIQVTNSRQQVPIPRELENDDQ